MNKAYLTIILLLLLCQCKGRMKDSSILRDGNDGANNDTLVSSLDTLPEGVRKLMNAYPSQIIGYSNNHLIMVNGERIVYDDKRRKDFVTMLDDSDPEDMLKMIYDRQVKTPLNKKYDAGRSRCEQLFKAMYGHSAVEVQQKLTEVDWFSQRIRFSSVNGCADSLRAVAYEISLNPKLLPYMKQSSSFYWRAVRGAKRQSAHSYGIAIDINTSFSDYWLWSNQKSKETDTIEYVNRIPIEIVKTFEKHGFIWGGRWYHYDTMHFEYRPEYLLQK